MNARACCLLHAKEPLVTTSSTSVTIKWANSKLAEMLRKREEEEALLRGNRVRHKDERSDDGKKVRRTKWKAQVVEDKPITQRWSGKVDYSKPSPLRDRPRSDTGATSFHFAVSAISKETSPTFNHRPVGGFKAGSENPGADHELYIGRELATEQAQDMEAYIARAGAVEIDGSVLEREPGRAYNDEVTEGLDDLTVASDASGVPSIFSNISDDAFERAEFWKAVHRTEREPRTQTILIDATKDPGLVRQMMTDERLPASFREVAALAYQDADAPRDIDDARIRPRAWQGDAEACGRVLVQLQNYDGFDPRRSGVTYKSGRGGTVQHRLVAELPHELTAAERAALVLQFCKHLEQIEVAEDGSTRGLMYTAAIHAPDAHNDARNYHLHVVFHDRPAKLLDGYGVWDFEVTEVFERKGEIRTRYPFRQEKLRMVRGLSEGADPEVSGRNFIPGLRREFSRITNEALERAGIERHYDPRTYKAMGIERTPTDHLGTKAAALEAAGVETTVGSLNAMKIWLDAQRDIERRAEQRKAAIEKREAILLDLMAEGSREPAAAEPLARLRAAVSDWGRVSRDVAEDSELIDGFDLMEAKARSRAEKVQATCLRTLADIQIGTAPSRDKKAQAKIEKRYDDASAWLAQIDAALNDGRPDIDKARAKIKRDEESAVKLSQEVDRLADELREALASGRATSARTTTQAAPVQPAKGPIAGQVDIVGIDGLDDTPPASPAPKETSAPPAQDQAPVQPAATAKANEGSVPVGPATAPATPVVPPRAAESDPKATPVPPVAGVDPKVAAPPDRTSGPAAIPPSPATTTKPVEPLQGADKNVSPHAPATPAAQPGAQPTAPSKAVPTAAPEPVAKAPPAPAEPALFDLPVQPAPVKPGSQADRQKQWNDLFDTIRAGNLFILTSGTQKAAPLTVPSMTEAERALLDAPEFAKRTQARLNAMKESQDQAVARLGKWLEGHVHDESKIRFEGRKWYPIEVPQAVQTLIEKYGQHPKVLPQLERGTKVQADIREVVEWIRSDGRDGSKLILSDGKAKISGSLPQIEEKLSETVQFQRVKDALREEYNRRQREIERASEVREGVGRREEAERRDVDLSKIRHPLVREFVKVSNTQGDPAYLHDIAKEIEITKQAREELLGLGREIGVAYTRAANTRPDSKAPASRKDRDRDF